MELLRDMALFVEVARKRNIKRASESLGIPDSTVSRRISSLEKSLGLRLFHRTTRRIDLTEAGVVYFAECEPIVEAAKYAQERTKDLVSKPQGRLKLSLPVDFSTMFLAPLIADFCTIYPQINFDLHLSEQWVNSSQEGFDLSIRLGTQPDSSVTSRHLADIRYALYASPDYLRTNGEPRIPQSLANFACIRMVCPHWDEVWTLMRDDKPTRVTFRERLAANNVALVRKFALLGLGIAPLDDLLVREDLEGGRLKQVLPEWQFQPVPVFALTPSSPLPVKTRAFIDFLVNRIKSSRNGAQALLTGFTR